MTTPRGNSKANLALVTGATAGIGAVFARRLAAKGYDLVLVARDLSRLKHAAEELTIEHGARVEVLSADLATDEGIIAVASRAADGVDLLINNAGFGQHGGLMTSNMDEELAMLKVHCEAVLRICRAALPTMIERGHGDIINVASVAAFFSRGTYSASKRWVVTFSDSLRQEILGTGVHVMALCPGWIHTEFHKRSGMETTGIPDFLWLDADALVTGALRDLSHHKAVSMPGWKYRALVGLGKILPLSLATKLSARAGSHH